MHAEPELWHRLMDSLSTTIGVFLETQIAAGVDLIQLFDSWAGYLTDRDYREFVLPYSRKILDQVASSSIPRIHFGVGTGELLGSMSEAGSEVMGVDWRVPLDVAAQRISAANGPKILQGNLDPAILHAGESVIRREVERITQEAQRAMAEGNARGHIFNLGHGVLPNTDPEVITRTVDIIHAQGVSH